MKSLNYILPVVIMTSMGCSNKSLLPSQKIYTKSSYETYDHFESDISNIKIGKTNYNDLLRMGIDLEQMPNVKKLTYLDIMEKFKLDSPSRYTLFNNIELPEGVIKSLSARENLKAYEINLEKIDRQREGSVIMDTLNFKKQTHTTGWRASALILIVNDTVEYILYSGERNIDKTEFEKNPLGPFQGFDGGDIIGAANDLDI
jgi:hypothetical protein